VLMALRPVFARLLSACGSLIFTATTATVPAMSAVTTVAEQMHPDERREHQHPHPVLR